MTRDESHILPRRPDWRETILATTSQDSARYRCDVVPVVLRWGKRLVDGARLSARAEGMTTSGWLRRCVAVQVERVTGVEAAILLDGEASPWLDRSYNAREDFADLDRFR